MSDPAPKIVDPDHLLVQAARNGDFEAFERLVAQYEQSIYTLAMRIVRKSQDAEEVVQETFLSVVEHLKDFQGASTFHTWLVRIATNHALKILRKRRGLPVVP
ncbi:MAG TPA: sigma-70 family RNA polymerase sigma factor, partial [Tepidisphaeraceae bacterium]|nr:sigma-70 family RNA polymerase sigma factor [Tepidisphaeraceae bacterium]